MRTHLPTSSRNRLLLLALTALIACGKSGDPKTDKTDKTGGAAGAESKPGAAAELVARAPTKIDGPSVAPVITSNITFVAPKDDGTWAEMAFPCYRAAIEMSPGASVADPFYQASPMVKPALAAAGIDIAKDVAAIGGWDCGGGPCFYLAATLRRPDKIGEMIGLFAPQAKNPEPGHWSFDAPGAKGPRTIHVRVVPIQWGDKVPAGPWAAAAAKATHVVFLSGIAGGDDAQPLPHIATGDAATARVRNAESVLSDPHRRCVVGTTGPSPFKPGFELVSSRFAMGLPPAKDDAVARMMSTTRTLDVEVELTLSAAATEADVSQWITEARAWVAQIGAPMRMQFAGQGAMVDAMFDAASLIGTEGFRHELADKLLKLSWRTDRVKQASLATIEAKLQGVIAP